MTTYYGGGSSFGGGPAPTGGYQNAQDWINQNGLPWWNTSALNDLAEGMVPGTSSSGGTGQFFEGNGMYGGGYTGLDPNRSAADLFRSAQGWLNGNPGLWDPYGGQMVAGQSPWTQAAAGQAMDVANFQPGNFLTGDISAYQNPYTDQVVNTALSDIDRSRQIANQQGARSAGASTYGGDRNALVEAETNRAYGDIAARTAAQLRSNGFDTAAGLMQSDQDRALRGAGLNLAGSQLLGQYGQQDWQRNQMGLDANYNEYLRTTYGPMQGFNFLAGLNSGNQYQPTSPWSGLLGLGMTAASFV